MATINKSVKINAPVSKVFKVVTSPDNWTRYVTSLVAIKNLSDDAPAKGGTFRWEYKMMGLKMTGKGEVTENVRNKRFALALKGKATISEHYEFTPNDDGSSTLKISIVHEMPSDILNKLMDTALVKKLNQIESGSVLKKIKVMCEGA